ncbi:SDR family oxidoreductase [uncultured Chloroflexus sp.]|uniref:SDR family NAD(P)-dependent oxidoreductase n=1 Tax=uncultured Chloroflexus sp. TaxID=214040 RepID=UPI002604EB58|nr:SDR family NAD(P)-dependent oxidoreductase [uncultured Chloroflexus sp.]
MRGQTIYGAAKAAVKLFTEGLYSELLATKVRVTVVFPGAVSTNITANSGVSSLPRTDKQPAITPLPVERAAQIIVEGMERNRFRGLVGNDATMMDRLDRLNPQFAGRLLFRQIKSLLAQ